MRTDADAEKQISLYLQGKLDQQQTLDFEHSLRSDPELKSRLEERLMIITALWEQGREEEKAQLKRLFFRTKNTQRIKRRRLLMAVAAMVVFLASFGFLFFRPGIQAGQLFETYYEGISAPETLGFTEQNDSLLFRARFLYNQKNFTEAILVYQVLATGPDSSYRSEAGLLIGICQMELNKWELALKSFEQVKAQRELADWYTALVYVRIKSYKKACAVLATISQNPEHFCQEKALSLMKRLE